ncbi:hypothetical protein [Wolbachia endosymbiont (group A) of Agelastica alni]|uniref:hypothetical protein n=1 Tax=Wolbachia endosymbiont (group A) of Agelastica alni TaxID=3066130 RepID=UPI003341A159
MAESGSRGLLPTLHVRGESASKELSPINSEKLLSSLAFNQAILIHIIWVRSQSYNKRPRT